MAAVCMLLLCGFEALCFMYKLCHGLMLRGLVTLFCHTRVVVVSRFSKSSHVV